MWRQPQPGAGSLQHALGGDDLLAQAGGGGLDIEDHRMRGVDQVVGLITEAPLAGLNRPGRLRIGLGEVLWRSLIRLVASRCGSGIQRLQVRADGRTDPKTWLTASASA